MTDKVEHIGTGLIAHGSQVVPVENIGYFYMDPPDAPDDIYQRVIIILLSSTQKPPFNEIEISGFAMGKKFLKALKQARSDPTVKKNFIVIKEG